MTKDQKRAVKAVPNCPSIGVQIDEDEFNKQVFEICTKVSIRISIQ